MADSATPANPRTPLVNFEKRPISAGVVKNPFDAAIDVLTMHRDSTVDRLNSRIEELEAMKKECESTTDIWLEFEQEDADKRLSEILAEHVPTSKPAGVPPVDIAKPAKVKRKYIRRDITEAAEVAEKKVNGDAELYAGMNTSSGRHFQAVALLKEGKTVEEAAHGTGLARKTVRKLADRLGSDDTQKIMPAAIVPSVTATLAPKPNSYAARPVDTKWGDLLTEMSAMDIGDKLKVAAFEGIELSRFANQLRSIASQSKIVQGMRFLFDAHTFAAESIVRVTRNDDEDWDAALADDEVKSGHCSEPACPYPVMKDGLCGFHLRDKGLGGSATGSSLHPKLM